MEKKFKTKFKDLPIGIYFRDSFKKIYEVGKKDNDNYS